ncbi:hypothetical protein ES319_A01G117100v1 [Gossypium barbadense]|uniref:Uncharacterized protein n=2 Tax=Gossypium TaxID=3633 RepID=A0A5J5WXR1_GOSBA|nr:hypothetical protein ES319_A01G117100v1 [Gossypium barbadense]TYH30841.1 hypothetical protein ES288_A01G126700v1 [Gossypium darwinii]
MKSQVSKLVLKIFTSRIKAPIFYKSSPSFCNFLIIVRESPSISTFSNPRCRPRRIACIYAIASAAKTDDPL